MSTQKTQKRLNTAIKSISELKSYLERAVRKLEIEAPGDVATIGIPEFQTWLDQQAKHWRRKRDSEPKSSEAFRFYHGKSEGIIEVLRHLEEEAGLASRPAVDRGYISGRNQQATEQQTASLNMQDTKVESQQLS